MTDMAWARFGAMVAAIALCAACNKPSAASAPSAEPAVATQPAGGGSNNPSGPVAAACGKEVAASDAQAILGTPITDTGGLPGVPGACAFSTAGSKGLDIELASGAEGEEFWQENVSTKPDSWVSVAGLGDRAMRNANGTVVLAQKGHLVCRATATGVNGDDADTFTVDPNALSAELGKLCAKVFTGRSA
jgi:hypothetical protein